MRENWSYQLAWPPKENERGERESRAGLPLILAPQQVTERIHGHARQARPGLQLRFHHDAVGIRTHPHLPARRRRGKGRPDSTDLQGGARTLTPSHLRRTAAPLALPH